MQLRVQAAVSIVLAGGWHVRAQTHKVEAPQQVVRAVAVYEWTGDLKSPKASRLVPVTVFIDGELHDAGVYRPQPIPFAIEPGVEYEVQRAGAPEGALVLETARHRTSDDNGEGDAWFGYGRYKAETAKPAVALRPSRVPGVIVSSKDAGGGPVLSRKDDGSRKGSANDSTKDSSGKDSQVAVDRPTAGRRDDTGSPIPPSGADTSASSDDARKTNASDDVDRPTLRRRTPEQDKKAKRKQDQPSVTARGAPDDDPDRPLLHRGNPSDIGEATGVPELLGTPTDLRQAVAVSDAAKRPEHEYGRAWSDDAERITILAKMQAIARTLLKTYQGVATATEMDAAAASVGSDPGRPALRRGTPSTAKSKHADDNSAGSVGHASLSKRGANAAGTSALPLTDEQLKGFTLSYGGEPTFVYTARTEGSVPRYVTAVVEQQISGELRPVLKSVTDAGHLDRTPWMRFVDAVDAEASNRASLLFELRYTSSRSFALYRILGASATQLAATGSAP